MKDPAFLFYPGDWIGGTLLLNRAQKGAYMDLLIAQFNNGPLELDEIKTLLGADFGLWNSLSKKFTFMNGRYSNERLEVEKNKRSNYTSSRRANAKHMHEHMEDRDEDRNVIEIKNEYGDEFKKVRLTPEEYSKLVTKLGEQNTLTLIGDLDRYIASNPKGKKYLSHYAVVLTWAKSKIEKHVESNKPKRALVSVKDQ